MALFKTRDRAKRDQHKLAHKAAIKAAEESYAFWRDYQSAYDQYTHVMNSWNEKPVTLPVFCQELNKLVGK